MFDLNYLLSEKGIHVPDVRVLVMRHVPSEPELRKALPWLAAEMPETYNVYQQFQRPHVERQLTEVRYVVSCVGYRSNEALFVGVYKVNSYKPVSFDEYWNVPENERLRSLGMRSWSSERDRPLPILRFDLQVEEALQEWKGKLVLDWPPGRTWIRRAERNGFTIKAILEDSVLDKGMPAWNQLVLAWAELHSLPQNWIAALKQWRGIYFIHDSADGKGYVGSACGDENIYGRWMNYAASGDGGNKLLRARKPQSFRFSVLQLVSQDMESEKVIAVENSWKDRLHTREFGLNLN